MQSRKHFKPSCSSKSIPKPRSSEDPSSRRSKKHALRKTRSFKDKNEDDDEDAAGATVAASDQEAAVIDIYCAITKPDFGNYYHWALSVHDVGTGNWSTFQVVQEMQDGPFAPERVDADPRELMSCLPLLHLGRVTTTTTTTTTTAADAVGGAVADANAAMNGDDDVDLLLSLCRGDVDEDQEFPHIQVPGDAASWNCQDYVLEIWEIMRDKGVVDQETWDRGKTSMLRYYGQDYGGAMSDDDDDDDGESEGEDSEDSEDGEKEGSRLDGNAKEKAKAFPLSEEYVYDSESSGEEEEVVG